MYRVGIAIFLAVLGFAQSPQDAEIVVVAKSPATLAQYLESHHNVDWKALRKSLSLKESELWLAPCSSDLLVEETPCSGRDGDGRESRTGNFGNSRSRYLVRRRIPSLSP